MFGFDDLDIPLIAAPMAGGPSTPALVTALAVAGGFGLLAAGYKTADAVRSEIETVRRSTDRFGVNVFVGNDDPLPTSLDAYAAVLAPLAASLGVEVPRPVPDDDGWDAKIDLLLETRVPVVSFTFGLPPRETVDALHRVGTRVAVSVASVDDARLALALGPDSLVVQGTQAGGHRATLSASEDANETPTLDLVRAIVPLGVPVVAAGGIACGSDIADALAAGARAVQLGTAFLLTPEAGTSTAHRAALRDPSFTATRVSRAYTGRPARGLDNALGRLDAPASYPAVHQLTGPIRRAAAASGDLQHTHLWAGTGWRSVREEPAAEVVTRLWAEASAQA